MSSFTHPIRLSLFFLLLIFNLYPLSTALSEGIEGHTVQPTFYPVDSLFSLSFIPGIRPSSRGIPGYPEPKPYALLGLGSYSSKDYWTLGGKGEGRLFFLSGTAKGLAVRKTDFGQASENDFSIKGSAAYRPTGQAGFEARYRGIEAKDELGSVRRTENVFGLSIHEADRKGTVNVQGNWAGFTLEDGRRASLQAISFEGETEHLLGPWTPSGRIRSSWKVSEEQDLGGGFYPQRLWGKGFLAAGRAFGNGMFLELGGRAEGVSFLSRNDAFAYPFLSLNAAMPRGYSATVSFEPSLEISSLEERYLYDPYLLVNPDAGYSRSPVRWLESLGYASSSNSVEFRFSEERLAGFWTPQDTAPGFRVFLPYGDVWKYSLETKACAALGAHFRESLEARGYGSDRQIPYDPRLAASNILTFGREGDSLRVRIDYTGRRFRTGGAGLKSYFLNSVVLENQVFPGIAVFFSAENLGDNRYELISGRRNQGRILSCAMTWKV